MQDGRDARSAHRPRRESGTHALPRLPARANCVITARVRRVHRMWYLKKKKKQRQGGGNDVEVTGGKV